MAVDVLPLADHPKIARAIDLALEGLRDLATARPTLSSDELRRIVEKTGELRGRPLFFPYLSSGVGRGARVRLADGRWLLDFALGIGVHFFGHGDEDLLRTAIAAALEDTVMQGNLQMGLEVPRFLSKLVDSAGDRIRHAWIANSGAEANESALKILRQKKHPATEVVAFRGCFHGRTTTMAELTDRPDYRRGQPAREVVHYLPWYSADDPEAALRSFRELLAERRGKIAALVLELVQGEAGFRTAPRDFFVPLLETCRDANVGVWIDEVQTFGRTGELFAFRRLGLDEYVDVVTIGKMLQSAAVLFPSEMRPDPALVSGTFAGSTVGLAVGRRIIERLETGGHLGPEGRIARLGERTKVELERLRRDLPERVRGFDGVGAMWAVDLGDVDHASVVALVRRAFDAGLVVYYGGAGPYSLRLFLPGGVLTDTELDDGFAILRRVLGE